MFIESPTTASAGRVTVVRQRRALRVGAGGRGLDRRGAVGAVAGTAVSRIAAVRWIRLDPCLVTHVLGAYDEPDGAIVLYVCCYGVPEAGQPVDLVGLRRRRARSGALGDRRDAGRAGALAHCRASGSSGCRSTSATSSIHGWTPHCEGAAFRYGYALETAWAAVPPAVGVPAAGRAHGTLDRGGVAGRPAEVRPRPGTRSPPGAPGPGAPRASRSSCGRSTATATTRAGCSPSSTTPTVAPATLRPRRLCTGSAPPRGGHPPAGTPARAQPRGVGSGRPLSLSARPVRRSSPGERRRFCRSRRQTATVHRLHGTRPRERRTSPRLGVAANRRPGLERDPAPPGDLRPPEPAPRGRGRTRPAEGVASRRRHLHGGLARPAVRRLRRHGTRMGHRGRQASVAAQDRRCAVAGKALLRPGEAARRSGQARDRRPAGRTGDALVGQAGPRARPGCSGSIRRPVDRLLRPALPPLRRPTSDADRDAPRRPVRRGQELAHRPGQLGVGRDRTPFDQRMADALGLRLQGRRRPARSPEPPGTAPRSGQAGGAPPQPPDRGRARRHDLPGRRRRRR